MRLYDEIINDILTDLSGQDVVKLPVGDAAIRQPGLAGCRKSNDDLTGRYGI